MKPYRFEDAPLLSRAEAEAQSALVRLPLPAPGALLAPFLKEELSIRLVGGAPPVAPPFAPSASFLHLASGGRARLVIDPRLAILAVERALGIAAAPTPRPLSEAEEGLLGAMLLAAQDSLPDPAAFALAELGGAPLPAAARLALELSLGPARGWGLLEVEPALARLALPRRAPPGWLRAHPLEGRLFIGRTQLTPAELASLRPSDTLLLDELRINEEGSGAGRLSIGGLRGDVSFSRAQARLLGGLMAEAGSQAPGAALELTVELGRLRARVEEISSWGPGTVLPLSRRPGDPVELVLDGKVVARGELVRVEGDLGLRLSWVAP
jgi:hypothetical protein